MIALFSGKLCICPLGFKYSKYVCSDWWKHSVQQALLEYFRVSVSQRAAEMKMLLPQRGVNAGMDGRCKHKLCNLWLPSWVKRAQCLHPEASGLQMPPSASLNPPNECSVKVSQCVYRATTTYRQLLQPPIPPNTSSRWLPQPPILPEWEVPQNIYRRERSLGRDPIEMISEVNFERPQRKCTPGRRISCALEDNTDAERICRVWGSSVGGWGASSAETRKSEHIAKGQCPQCRNFGLDL